MKKYKLHGKAADGSSPPPMNIGSIEDANRFVARLSGDVPGILFILHVELRTLDGAVVKRYYKPASQYH